MSPVRLPSVYLAFLVMVALPIAVRAQQGCPAGFPTDSHFILDSSGNTPQYPGDFPVFFRVTRVVGPGTAGEFTSGQPDPRNNGFITASSWQIYRTNGVVGSKAQVSLSATVILPPSYYNQLLGNTLYWSALIAYLGGTGPSLSFPPDGYVYAGSKQIILPVTIQFTLNGKALHQMSFLLPVSSSGSTQSLTICKPIPDASWIKYARMLDPTGGTCTSNPRPGETTCPGVNEIEAKYVFNKGLERTGYGVGGNPFNIIARASDLSFRAMAPVLMVHGINTNEQWFNQANLFNPTFVKPFGDAKIPYALLCTYPNLGMGDGLIPTIGGRMYSLVQLFAGKFGANKVHLVAHSKGGLWSRYFLDLLPSYSWHGAPRSDSFGVLSLITIDTPHHGTVGADVKAAWKTLPGSMSRSHQRSC